MAEDYYHLLGVSKSATVDEIKKAFRKKAHELHPDKSGGDAEKFKQVNEAYQVLSHPQKRQQYDQYGAAGPSAGGFGGPGGGFNQAQWQQANVDFGDLGDMFGDLFGFGGGSRRRTQAQRGQDIEAQLSVPFREAVFGSTKTIELKHHILCDHCGGDGAEPGSSRKTCTMCQGSGQVRQTQQTFLGPVQSVVTCPTCRGEGRMIEKPCKQCKGEGRRQQTETITVKIPAGIDNGQRIRLVGKGEAGRRGTPSGDLYLHVQVERDAEFERQGDDILSQVVIPLSVAALGGKASVSTLEGQVNLKIPAGTKSGQEFSLRHRGVPNVRGSGRGDQRVTVTVEIPKKLTVKQKKLLQELQDSGL